MIALDAGVLVRYLAQDDAIQSARATEFIENELSAEQPGFLPLVALVELYWVLHRCYGQGRADWSRTLRGLLTARQIVVENLPAAWNAMLACDEGLDFAEALLAATAHTAGARALATFDPALARHPHARLLA